MGRTRSIAIVGAGMAGCTAARALADHGWRVAVFDKGRQVGGRMATRSAAGGISFDHGAQYFTAHGDAFKAAVADFSAQDVLAPWGEPGWFVAHPDMPALPKAMLGQLPVTTHCRILELSRAEAGWRLRAQPSSAKATGAAVPGAAFDAVLLACPAPQTAALLATAGVVRPEIAAARYAPCWALMLGCDGPPLFEAAYRRASDPDAGLAWIARNSTKPGREAAGETLVAHAAPAWSRARLEDDAETVVHLMLKELRSTFPDLPDDVHVSHAAAHRWRYGQVEHATQEPCHWWPSDGLGACGDWCVGGRVEAAYLSGRALAQRVLEDWA